MLEFEDASDGDRIKYLVKGKALTAKRALVHKLRWMIWNNRERIYFKLDAMLATKCTCSMIIDEGVAPR